jgi:hypothetical protein
MEDDDALKQSLYARAKFMLVVNGNKNKLKGANDRHS